jgi:hypothetical protein
MELESLLSHARGLKELSLNLINLDDTSTRPADSVSHKPLVVLDYLDVLFDHRVATEAVDAMLSTFSVLDIRHLRSLRVGPFNPLIPLLRVNSGTLERVQYYVPFRPYHLFPRIPNPDGKTGPLSDPDILETNTRLRHIDLGTDTLCMADGLKVFGNLRHLMALHTVSLHFDDQFGTVADEMRDEVWVDLNEVLAQVRDTLKEVEIYAHTDKKKCIPPDLALLRSLLPSVAQKISVYPTEEEENDNDEEEDEE